MAQSSYEESPQPQGASDPGHPFGDGDRDPTLMPDDPPMPPAQVDPLVRGDDDEQ
jgi:hypothetical protein